MREAHVLRCLFFLVVRFVFWFYFVFYSDQILKIAIFFLCLYICFLILEIDFLLQGNYIVHTHTQSDILIPMKFWNPNWCWHDLLGITEPIKSGIRDSKLGIGKQEEDDFFTAEENIQRKKLDIELEETEEIAKKREVCLLSPT